MTAVRPRLLVCLVVLLGMLTVFPLTASAAAPNIGRITATSYVDGAGSEGWPLCGQYNFITVEVNFSGVGPDLAGSGSGSLTLSLSGPLTEYYGTISINGSPAEVEGVLSMICVNEGYAIFTGDIFLYKENRVALCGGVTGSLTDGVHRSQGRFSFVTSGLTRCLTS